MGKLRTKLICTLFLLALLDVQTPLSAAEGASSALHPVGGEPTQEIWPTATWVTATPEEMGLDSGILAAAQEYALRGGGSGMITRSGVLVMSWGSPSEKYDLKSAGKSIGITALGLAMQDGLVQLGDLAQKYHPNLGLPPDSNLETGWLDQITIQHLATMTAGFDKNGGFTELLFQPGTGWAYSDGGPNWLAEALTLTYREDLYTLLGRRVFTPLGIPESELSWRDHYYRPTLIDDIVNREFGGIHASVDAMARLGLLYLRGGRWEGEQQILSPDYVKAAAALPPQVIGLPVMDDPHLYPGATSHYGLLWWNNADGSLPNVPLDAYWAWGLYESLILVIPSLEIVAARASYQGWQAVTDLSPWTSDYRVIEPFIEPVAQAAIRAAQRHKLWLPVVKEN